MTYFIRPSIAKPSKIRRLWPDDLYDFELDQVELAAMGETLQTTLAANPFSAFVRGFLAPYTDRLIWLGEGPGIGREMRRAFSAIFGRFFARAYLNDCHGLVWFVPLDGPQHRVSERLRVASPGPRQDLPDWICAGRGVLALAEAKGSRTASRLTYWSQPAAIKQAIKQLQSCRVSIFDRASQSWIDRKVKGWAVLNQWRFQRSNTDPYLFVVDPETEGEPLPHDAVPPIIREIAREHVSGLLRGLRLIQLAISISYSDILSEMSELSLLPTRVSIVGLGTTATGRFYFINPGEASTSRFGDRIFVGVQDDVLDDLRSESNAIPAILEPLSLSEEGVLRGADGLVVANRSAVTVIGQ